MTKTFSINFKSELLELHRFVSIAMDELTAAKKTIGVLLRQVETLENIISSQEKEIARLRLELEATARILSERK